jgi:hypothetical protein
MLLIGAEAVAVSPVMPPPMLVQIKFTAFRNG